MTGRVEPRFVDFVPPKLEPGILYVAIQFGVTAHLCACGCENVVNASLSPVRWSMEYDGETISMYPSFGNFSFPCKSHYWIRRNQIRWARRYSADEIEQARQTDADDTRSRYDGGRT